jgi:thymidylate synthase
MSKEYTKEEATEFLKQIGQPTQAEQDSDTCPTCGFEIHPCIPCEEIAASYNGVDGSYFGLVREILENGRVKKNRTGIDTIGVFGAQAKYDVNLDAFPILTTKKVWFKGIVHELLWFIKGDTNIKYLVDNDVHIWDEWAYKRYCQEWEKEGYAISVVGAKWGKDIGARSHEKFTQQEFIQRIKDDAEFALKFGELGEGTYGGMWRDFPHFKKTYEGPPERCGVGDEYEPEGVDQLKKAVDKLKSNPDDRRIIVSAWHPYWVDHCALPPCHCLFHFNTEELTLEERKEIGVEREGMNYKGMEDGDIEVFLGLANIPTRKLNCLLYQRSCDTFLGVPFNITSYALLTAMIAHVTNMVPGTFTHTYGDLHIYTNHLEQLKLQETRIPRKLPKLVLNPEVKSLFDFKFEDIKLEGYNPHAAIKGQVAV